MYYFRLLFILLQLFLLSFCHADDDDYFNKTIKWPETYHFRGDKIYLKSDLIETFEIWYVSQYNNQSMSRKDFYEGTVKTLYFGETDNETGIEYTIYPMSTEYSSNTIVCEKEESYSSDAKTFLPESYYFSFEGFGEVEGKRAEEWAYTDTDDDKTTEFKIWVKHLGDDEYIPLRYETKEYDSWRGEVLKEIIVNFYDFHNNVTEADFVIESDYGCDEMRGTSRFIDPDSDEHIETAFHSFKKEHKKTYKHEKEHNYRKKIFRNNLQRIISKNRQNLSYKLGVTKFADRTKEELQMSRGIIGEDHVESGAIMFPHSAEDVEDLVSRGEIPMNLDLRIEGLVRPVEDQLSCGSCWAFTTTAAIEGAVAKSNGGRLPSLSQQSFVDCAWGFGNMGCSGGILSHAFKWALKHGVPTTEEYGPYLQKNGYCKMDDITNEYKIKGFAEVTPLSENAMKVALFKYGPVAVSIYASDSMFLYKNGVFYDTECEGESVNHGVTVVGYGELNGDTYWIIKNSWGHTWGEDGYMLISTRNNNCFILNQPYYAVV